MTLKEVEIVVLLPHKFARFHLVFGDCRQWRESSNVITIQSCVGIGSWLNLSKRSGYFMHHQL